MSTTPTRVHVIFKTHLDIGFTGFSRLVTERYLDEFMPQALALARTQRENGGERFVWTTGSWLPYIGLERLRGARRRELEAGLAAGDLRWHALPFTMHCEGADVALIRRGLEMSQALDRRFGRRTIAAKMTDVPGHTCGLVPILAEAGVRLLHLGVNPASAVPDVPPLFRWQCAGSELAVMYAASYGDIGQAPGAADVLAFAHAGDNCGPPKPEEIATMFAGFRTRFPGARVAATSMDEYAATLGKHWQDLPVVDGEIGDTWIHGLGTDPAKVAGLRALSRLHAAWTVEGRSPRQVAAFGRALLMVVEHTWGLDVKTHLSRVLAGGGPADSTRWTNAAFRRSLRRPEYRTMIASWDEQRAYLDQAVAALGRGPLAVQAKRELAATRPKPLGGSGWKRSRDGRIDAPRWQVAVDPVDGSLTTLLDRADGRRWADRAHRLGGYRYQTFSCAEYRRFHGQYLRNTAEHGYWSLPDFGKPGMETAKPRARLLGADSAQVWQRRHDDGLEVRILLRMPAEVVADAGCPRQVELLWRLPDDGDALDCRLRWIGKSATRLPEASWLLFNPAGVAPEDWRLHKLGQAVDPLRVVGRGNRRLHGVQRGAHGGWFALETLDAALVAPGGPGLLDFSQRQPDLRRGIAVNLHNTIWGTNFPMWYGEDAQFRFRLAAAPAV